jgi:CheY-like chemotaxis protein
MCIAVRVLCAAPEAESLAALKRAASGAEWEVTGGATSGDEALEHVRTWLPHVLVFDARLGKELGRRAAALHPGLRTVSVGEAEADLTVGSLEEVRTAVATSLRRDGGE